MTRPSSSASIDELQKIKKLADKSIEQLSDEQLHVTIDPDANSVAVLMRHMAGNMRSRWIDFLTSDGEKPDRMRDREFEDPGQTRAELHGRVGARLAMRVRCADAADRRRPAAHGDDSRRGALGLQGDLAARSRTTPGHAYQILLLAKHLQGPNWKTLSIPRGQSEEFNRRMLRRS